MTITKIQNIRDLLIVAIAPDLKTILQRVAPDAYISDAAAQEIAAVAIDGITPRSVELLAKLHGLQSIGDLQQQREH